VYQFRIIRCGTIIAFEVKGLNIYTVSQKNWTLFISAYNFCKYCPILILLSLLKTEIMCPQTNN